MNLFVRMTGAVAAAAIIGAGAAPAGAVLATDYIAPKLAQMGKSSVPIAGYRSFEVTVRPATNA
ncbi:MAG: hypothetical protein NVS1B6_12880 [Steroidobacteraceae bacterium]